MCFVRMINMLSMCVSFIWCACLCACTVCGNTRNGIMRGELETLKFGVNKGSWNIYYIKYNERLREDQINNKKKCRDQVGEGERNHN